MAVDFLKPPDFSLKLGRFQELLNSKLIFQLVMKIYLSGKKCRTVFI